MVLRIGDMRHELEVENPTESRTDTGAYTRVYHREATIFAAVTPLSVRQQFQNSGTGVTCTHQVKTWYHELIHEGTRFKWGSRYLYVVSVLNKDELNVELEILAEERKDES